MRGLTGWCCRSGKKGWRDKGLAASLFFRFNVQLQDAAQRVPVHLLVLLAEPCRQIRLRHFGRHCRFQRLDDRCPLRFRQRGQNGDVDHGSGMYARIETSGILLRQLLRFFLQKDRASPMQDLNEQCVLSDPSRFARASGHRIKPSDPDRFAAASVSRHRTRARAGASRRACQARPSSVS